MSLTKINKYFLLFVFVFQNTNPYTIMIDPAGDGQTTGREIQDSFERAVSMKCAQELKESLNKSVPSLQVIVTRSPSETVQPLQNASFANRLEVDLYISLAFYHEPNIPAYVSIFYHLQEESETCKKNNNLHFYSVTKAHCYNLSSTKKIASIFLKSFKQKELNSFFTPRGSFGIPCMPLFGIKSPAICIETGLTNKDDWKNIIPALVDAIEKVIG